MRSYDRTRPLISIHIPKCAGTSFRQVLQQWYGNRLLTHYFNEKRNPMPKRHRLTTGLFNKKFKEGICIHGHFNRERGAGVLDYYPEVDQLITILRDPFELHLSNFFFVKRLGHEAFRNGKRIVIATDDSYDLKRYLEETSSFMLLHLPADLTLDNYRDILEERFIYVGIAEDLQGSVDQLSRVLGFSSVTVGRKNVSPRTQDVPDGTRERFVRKHPLEFAIYEWALEHYKG